MKSVGLLPSNLPRFIDQSNLLPRRFRNVVIDSINLRFSHSQIVYMYKGHAKRKNIFFCNGSTVNVNFALHGDFIVFDLFCVTFVYRGCLL